MRLEFLQLLQARAKSLCYFYVYGYRHPITKVWRYIGKGYTKDGWDRKTRHLECAKRLDWEAEECPNPRFIHWIRKLLREGLEPEIVLVREGMSNEHAYAYEAELIAYIGRIETGGTLYNLTDGGEGLRGPSKETRRRMSESHKGKKNSEVTRHRISLGNQGKVVSKETRYNMSLSHTGKKHAVESRRKISEAQLGRKPYVRSVETCRKGSKSNLGKNLGKKRIYREDGSYCMQRIG